MKTSPAKNDSSQDSKSKRRLLEQIASMVEHAYRRGFQHGVNSGVTDEEARWFRYECRTATEKKTCLLRHATGAPWSDEPKRKPETGMSAISRLDCEIPCSDSHRELIELIREVGRL